MPISSGTLCATTCSKAERLSFTTIFTRPISCPRIAMRTVYLRAALRPPRSISVKAAVSPSGVDLKVEFWRFRPCLFFGSNGSPHCKDLQTMVSHAHWEHKLPTRHSLRFWLCHTVLGIAVKAPRAWLHYFSVNDLGPAAVAGLGLMRLVWSPDQDSASCSRRSDLSATQPRALGCKVSEEFVVPAEWSRRGPRWSVFCLRLRRLQ